MSTTKPFTPVITVQRVLTGFCWMYEGPHFLLVSPRYVIWAPLELVRGLISVTLEFLVKCLPGHTGSGESPVVIPSHIPLFQTPSRRALAGAGVLELVSRNHCLLGLAVSSPALR